jgi:membrane-associated phospholipid phosphatase
MQQLLNWDISLTALLRLAERPGPKRFSAMVLAHSGDSWFWLAGLAVMGLLGSSYWQERARILAAGIIVTAVLVLIIKFIVRRKRPEGEWGAIYRTTDPHSFPSGHAARAALIAILALLLGPPWFAALLLIWAPLVSLARVAMGVHYLSDILAGSVVGVLMALLLTHFLIL